MGVGMIIEFFGPPGVGKTTLVCALAERLRERGRVVKPMLSYRPAEDPIDPLKEPARHQTAALARRLVRPMTEIFTAVGHPSAGSCEAKAAAQLMALLPPRNIVWSLRLHQYMRRLSRSWREAALTQDIVLFDQGFVQALSSLAFLARAADPARIALALDAMPQPDLLVRLGVPPEILETRLAARLRQQGWIERLLEFDLERNLESARMIDQVHELLRMKSRPITCVDSDDRWSLRRAVDKIEELVLEREVLARSGAERRRTA
jgi:thymidylate kinase